MEKKLLHTPEGVRDIYNEECAKKIYLQNTIRDTLISYGYSDIQTPTFEFIDIYNQESGSALSKDMYKFFDREGYTLVLRPDMTPAIARAVSKYYMDETMPVRFCYVGNTFINHAEHQGKLKERTQIGIELIGDNKSDADAEVIAMTIDSLLKCGLDEFQIEIGHVDYFRGLSKAAGLDDENTKKLMKLLQNKNFFGIEELITSCDINEEVKNVFDRLPYLTGSIDVINMARTLYTNEMIENALDRMEKLYEILSFYGFEKYVSFDLGITANYTYYSGIIFKGYTYGTGNPIATGGRYDNLLKLFGKDAPSIGFAIDVDGLLSALNRQKINVGKMYEKTLIIYDEDKKAEAIYEATKLRDHGIPAVSMRKSSQYSLEHYELYCHKNSFDTLVYISGSETVKKEF